MRGTASLGALAFTWAAACWSRTAHAGDPQDVAQQAAAQRARDRVSAVFARPEFDPLAQADRIPLPEVPEEAKTWIAAFFDVMGDAAAAVLNALWSVFGGLLRWLGRGVGNLFGGGGGGVGAPAVGAWVGWLLAAAAAALIVFLVWRLVRSSRMERAARAAAATLHESSAPLADDALAKSPEEWRRNARELAAGGARRDSLRALYLALLASLHRVGAIRYDRTRTNTAYVVDIDRAHAAHGPFLTLTRRFDAAWYGGHEPEARDLDAATREADTILSTFRAEAAHA